jgi:hypothetical protein
VEPDRQKCPAWHGPVQELLVSPVVAPYSPEGQSDVHELEFNPSVSPYLPVEHKEHVPEPLLLNLPSGQMLAVAFVVPAGHAYPAGHCPEHQLLTCPDVASNRPEGQMAVQLAAFRPEVLP